MASDNEASCASDPNFAVICSFLECFGKSCGIVYPDIASLQEMLENMQEVPQQLIDLHIKLLRKTRKTVSPEKWERALVKFCHTYSNQDGWELERFGYKKARIAVKLRLLKVLLESQFDLNQKFKNEVNKLAANELRVEPLGRDKSGLAYWCQFDEECNIRVYREDIDEENWELVAKDRDGVVSLINTLTNGEAGSIPINEDSNSLEISEKPIIDTGQVTTSPSLEDETVQENGNHIEEGEEKKSEKELVEDFEDDQEADDLTNEDLTNENDEEDMEVEGDLTHDESSKQNTEEDDSQEAMQDQTNQLKSTNVTSPLSMAVSKTLNGKVDLSVQRDTDHKESGIPCENVTINVSDSKVIEPSKPETLGTVSKVEDPVPLKSIETPVITSPLKLVNIAELKQEKKTVGAITPIPNMPISASLSASKKHIDETPESILKPIDKMSGKNALPFASMDPMAGHNKLSIKPIDQLAANLVRMQSEKLEKPKSLEKIAETLAKTGSIVSTAQVPPLNGEDDRLQDFSTRNQVRSEEKASMLRGPRGMDLSTSPRGWESANEQNRPMDFSGIDLSSRKFSKTMDLPSPGYRPQDFQHREMDLSTKKVSKDIPNLPYDARAVMMRNHAMVADLSKRQMPFTAYEMSSPAYHNTSRVPAKDEHRLPSYTLLPDPSKLAALRMGAVKRSLEGDETQQDMLKRIRADVIPIRGSMEKRPIISNNWREEVSEPIDEPVMMVQGEGSGSDCEANPIVGEAIEEPTIFFYGEGSGRDCDTGNPGDDNADNKESSQSKNEADSATKRLSPNKVLEDNLLGNVSSESIVASRPAVKLNRNFPQTSIKDNCQLVESTQEKPKFKPTLGVQVIPKTTGGSIKRLSRWDVGKPVENAECDSSIISNEEDISQKESTIRDVANAEQLLHVDEGLSNIEYKDPAAVVRESGYVQVDGNSVDDVTATKEADLTERDYSLSTELSIEQEAMQCDSSISLCQADTSEVTESLSEKCTADNNIVPNTSKSSDTLSEFSTLEAQEKNDNECKVTPTSPPRFFFGPNCISYTSKQDETQPDQTVSTSVECKFNTVQYECVSSSKTVEDTPLSYKSEDFDVIQTNNNSLKVSSFTSESNNVISKSGNTSKSLNVEALNSLWKQETSTKSNVEDFSQTVEEISGTFDTSTSTLNTPVAQSTVCTDDNLELRNTEEVICSSEKLNSESMHGEKMDTSSTVSQFDSTNNVDTSVNEESLDGEKVLEYKRMPSPVDENCSTTDVSTMQNTVPNKFNKFAESEINEISNCSQGSEEAVANIDSVTTDRDGNESLCPMDIPNTCSGSEGVYIPPNTQMFSEQKEDKFQGTNNSFHVQNSLMESGCSNLFKNDNHSNNSLDSTNSSVPMDCDENNFIVQGKNDPDSAGENCDKQSDKNDNFSECDAQEGQLTDTDIEKMKALSSSDADSMYANYDKNSEGIDAFSDSGMQDEGSGDSQEMKQKSLGTPYIKDDVNDLETVPGDNLTITSSEFTEECIKDTLPVTSSSNNSSQGPLSQENVSTSFPKELINFNTLPSAVPDSNILNRTRTAEPAKDISLSRLVHGSHDFADDVSENPSSCIDQDSNQDMVIDDRASESNESSKEIEDSKSQDEKLLPSNEDSLNDGNADKAQLPEELNESFVKSIEPVENQDVASSVATNEESVLPLESSNDTECQTVGEEEKPLKEQEEEAHAIKDQPDEQNTMISATEDSPIQDIQKDQFPENEENLSQNDNVETVEAVDNKKPLVANYESDSNEDGSDDVFEPDVADESDSEQNACLTTEEISSVQKELDKNVEDNSMNKQNIQCENSNTLTDMQQVVPEILEKASTASSDSVEEESAKQESAIPQVMPECNNIEYKSNDDVITTHNDESKGYNTELSNASHFDVNEINNVPTASAVTEEFPKSELFLTNSETNINETEIKQSATSDTFIMENETDNELNQINERSERSDSLQIESTNNFDKRPRNEENVTELNISNQMIDMMQNKDDALDDRLMNVDNIKVSENMQQQLPPISDVQSFNSINSFSELDVKENKIGLGSNEECINKFYMNKECMQENEMVTSVVPTKLDNMLNTDNLQTCNDNVVSHLSETKLLDNLNFANVMSEKSESLKLTGEYKPSEPYNTINKLTEYTNESSLNEKTEISDLQGQQISDISNPPLECKLPEKEPDITESKQKLWEETTFCELGKPINEPLQTYTPSEASNTELDKTAECRNDNISTGDLPPSSNLAEENNLVTKDTKEASEIQSINIQSASVESDDSSGPDNESIFNTVPEEVDPLACIDDEAAKSLLNDSLAGDAAMNKIGIRVKPVSELVYEGWKLDGTEPSKLSRKRRNSAQESNSDDLASKQEDDEMMGGKRIKLRAKRMPDKQLRKSVEDSRAGSASSEDEAVKGSSEKIVDEDNKEGSDEGNVARSLAIDPKSRGRPRGRRRRGYRARSSRTKHFRRNQVSEATEDVNPDGTSNVDLSLGMTPSATQKKRKKRKMVLGLEIGRDIAPETGDNPDAAQNETPVRQSRRIAQLKIKEEADRRRIEEEALSELKEKKEASEKKKKRKQKPESEEDAAAKELEKELKSKKKRKKRKKKKLLAKFNEANPWQSSSGSSSDEENDNEDDEEEEEDIESEGSLLFKSDHEFSPESDLEKDQESEPLRRARTAQKAQSDVEEADDEYACQKCGKADHPEWILLCDSCDKGWHCSCLRPALMLIPEGDWFCPPCQHNLLVTKLRDSLKVYDQLTKKHENEVLRKKRLAFVGISLDNVLHKGESPRMQKGSKASSQEESDNEDSSSSASSASTTESSSSEESEPVYQLRERRCANTYKFNEYDDMINAAIQDEVEAVQGAGNQGRGKDIATIVNAEKEEAQAEARKMTEVEEEKEDVVEKLEKDSDEEYKVEKEDIDDDVEEEKQVSRRLLARKKHRKLNSLDISSEDDPESDEDFKGTSSEEEEDFDDHLTSSDDSTFTEKRRGRRGDPRPVRRSTRARMTRYDDDFINDDSEDSDRPKRKKSRSMWGDSDSEDSDNSWRQRKKKSRALPSSRSRALSKTKGKKKKKRKRIIESDNQSDNDEEDDQRIVQHYEPQHINTTPNENQDIKPLTEQVNENENNVDVKPEGIEDPNIAMTTLQLEDYMSQKKKKESVPKQKKTPTIRRKIIYGGLPDENCKQEEEEILSRRTRGRKINYQEVGASDSEEELKKALRKTGESEDEFVVNEGDDMNDDAEKDSDSGDIYTPKKDGPRFKNRSPKTKKPRNGKSPGANRRMLADGTPKQRKKPGPKPGSKNKARKQNLMLTSVIKSRDELDAEKDVLGHGLGNAMSDLTGKIDEGLSETVGLSATTMSVASSFTGDVQEGSLTGLGAGELADLDDDQLEQMMMEDEEYGRRQLELAAIEIAKKKKKEEREAKKLEKARQKALEILAAERQRDPNAPEGTDGEAPKKKKRGRRSKAEILAEQMRRDGAPLASGLPPSGDIASSISPSINSLPTVITDVDRGPEGHMPLIAGPEGQLFNPDGTPVKPRRRGRGKGKKTLALEAARAAEAAAKAAAEAGLLSMGTDSNPDAKVGDLPNILPTPGSSTSGSAPSTPPAGVVVTTQGPPATQPSNSQSVYPNLPPGQQSSVITRMLQSQPVSSTPQSFTAAAAAMGHKYFGGPNGGQMMGPRPGYDMPRGRIPSPYRQPGQSSMHFAAVRSGTPPMRMRVPGPQLYHTPHHPMDPSPSGGGPISINNRDRSSPLAPGPAMIPPAAGSPLAKSGPTPPPPPPYVRGGPGLSRFPDNIGPRHQIPPFTNASPGSHGMQQPSPPPNRPPGNFSPYHPPPPPNYHYGAYPPPPPLSTADDAAAYQSSPYPGEHFPTPADSQPPIQAPPPQPPPQQPGHPGEAGPGNKQYDEEGTGEFGGLVSYFSSQREDDLDS